ncbi:MAG: 50S ribosome-binding GTPase [Candidatus Heimdallarchaeota archaeon]|nr:50S ribosome-binding GTPase [Candidatus Heimdallarchaeota archaeon]
MSLFKKLSKARETKGGNSLEEKKTVAIVGLDGAGKTTIVNRLLKSEYNLVRPTFGINIEIYKYRSLEFIVYDLGGQTPLRETLWEKFVSSADGLVFVLDSADKTRFTLASEEFENALNYNKKAPVLFISNKIDLDTAASADEVMRIIDFSKLNRIQRKNYFARCSALTGELLFESWDWLTLELSEKMDLPSLNVKIIGGYLFYSDGSEIETVVLGKPRTQHENAEIIKKGRYELDRFIRQMKNYPNAETLLQIAENQLFIVKANNLILGVIIGENDPVARAVQITKRLNNTVSRKLSSEEKFCFKTLIEDNYPLDIITDSD